jgi:hypothetical protein
MEALPFGRIKCSPVREAVAEAVFEAECGGVDGKRSDPKVQIHIHLAAIIDRWTEKATD